MKYNQLITKKSKCSFCENCIRWRLNREKQFHWYCSKYKRQVKGEDLCPSFISRFN